MSSPWAELDADHLATLTYLLQVGGFGLGLTGSGSDSREKRKLDPVSLKAVPRSPNHSIGGVGCKPSGNPDIFTSGSRIRVMVDQKLILWLFFHTFSEDPTHWWSWGHTI